VRVFYPRLTSEEIIARLRAGVLELERSLPLIRLVLFGSYAAGSYTVGSDVDLLVVHKGEPRVRGQHGSLKPTSPRSPDRAPA